MRIKIFLYGLKLGCTKFYDLYSTPFTNYVLAEEYKRIILIKIMLNQIIMS